MFVDFYRMCGRNLPQDYYLAIVVKKNSHYSHNGQILNKIIDAS